MTSHIACLSQYSEHGPESLLKLSPEKLAEAVVILRESDLKYSGGGYTVVGTVEVQITLHTADEMVTNKVKTLQAELARDRAESEKRQNAILNQISKLQALEFEA